MRTDPAEATEDELRPLDRAAAEDIARSLRAMADPTRVQLLGMIVGRPDGRALVGELATALGLSQPTVSHHMRIMTEEGLLARDQVGRQVWYSVVPERVGDVLETTRNVDDTIAAVVAVPVLARITDDLATRFRGTFSHETVERYVQESYELLARQAKITRYLPSFTARFAGDRLRSLAAAEGRTATDDRLRTDAPGIPGASDVSDVHGIPGVPDVPEVLFVCVQNAGRSQLASAILRSLAGERVRVLTAGSAPAGRVNPMVVAALDEIGVPLAGEYPKPLTDEVVRAADYVITMGCGDACPVYPGRTYLDWDLADPVGLPMEGVRAIRDEIEARVRALLADLDRMPPATT
ncbi:MULTISPECIES: metalloregulator ArsR/SmtB family transcription factor [unclassified Cryobacterium]|uniref:metalloregulator ArsR/SmtB family transcription factor n=1 Tax=unclassified Cryobacterium TaxID=2649013 RepID=UPI002AB3E189|nr:MULTISPECIES: metalloregulator ArsR/SmtB family transcription factor [unclassified Cryobacterium]MDY7541728.1 metalloregulator ArsR/SmtB family transcription factor [Cryobacterium sp. 5B3]MEA9999603.1 metalloregulator ArsR/SmtB family transcription factor [Cryobacterium sp. RTS3]MEB0267570.1 metalloregulator ArsR/SmtB family transcription factor [Cryobacterium sp. 10I5]MEB0276500.1 metalloregulator ArsR/SmtB family transcription factor [Cryobacterium sp. 5B3]